MFNLNIFILGCFATTISLVSSSSIPFDTCVDRKSAYTTSNCCASSPNTVPVWAGHTCNITNYYADIDKSIRAWYVFDATGATYHLQFGSPFDGSAIADPRLALIANKDISLALVHAQWEGYKIYPVSDTEVLGTLETCDTEHPQNGCYYFDHYINFGIKFIPDESGGVSSFEYPYGAPMLSSTNMTILGLGLWPTGMYSDTSVFETGRSYAIRDPFEFATTQTRTCYKH